jgi:hypothetical protein
MCHKVKPGDLLGQPKPEKLEVKNVLFNDAVNGIKS